MKPKRDFLPILQGVEAFWGNIEAFFSILISINFDFDINKF